MLNTAGENASLCVELNSKPVSNKLSVKIAPVNKLLILGTSINLQAKAGPALGSCSWSSSDSAILLVTESFSQRATSVTNIRTEGIGTATVTITYTTKLGEITTDSIELTVIDLDIDVSGIPDADEESVGAFLPLSEGAGSIRELTFRAILGNVVGKITLDSKSGADKIRLWSNASKTKRIQTPTLFNPTELPSSLFVEGIEPTVGSREIELSLTIKSDYGQISDSIKLSVVRIDLDVDSDRDGIVHDDSDETGENAWTESRGAMFMVNYDDDDGDPDGFPDAIGFDVNGLPISEDFIVNGPYDTQDLTEVIVRIHGIDTNDLQAVKLHVPRLDHIKGIHMFDAIEQGRISFWGGPNESNLATDLTKYLVTGGKTTFGIEGLFFRYTEPGAYGGIFEDGYHGELELELTATGPKGTSLGSDQVLLRVAPFVILPNTQDAVEIWGRDLNLEDFRSALQDIVPLHHYQAGEDQWTQDHIEIGYTQAPGRPKTHIVLQLPRARLANEGIEDDTPQWPSKHLLRRNQGLFRFWNFHITDGLNAGDYGGNIELMPPTQEWPLGRILVGNTISPPLLRFLQDQRVQDPFQISTEWLRVGHVDEVLAFVPNGNQWSLVIADPIQAKMLLAPLEEDAVFFKRGQVSSGYYFSASPESSKTTLVDSANTNFRHPRWEFAKYIRIYNGVGAGQVARISSKDSGILTVDKVWQTPTKAADLGYSGPGESTASINGQLDSISIPPSGQWFNVPDETSRYLLIEDTLFWIDGIGREVPAVISVHEIRNDSLLWDLNDIAAYKIEEIVDQIVSTSGNDINVIRVPDFFMGSFSDKGNAIEDAFAFAPALANLQVAGGWVFFAERYGPQNLAGNDVLQHGFATLISGSIHTIDGWDRYHRWIGNIHCFTYVKRAPFEFNWWSHISER